jgi:hypothetical protein
MECPLWVLRRALFIYVKYTATAQTKQPQRKLPGMLFRKSVWTHVACQRR